MYPLRYFVDTYLSPSNVFNSTLHKTKAFAFTNDFQQIEEQNPATGSISNENLPD